MMTSSCGTPTRLRRCSRREVLDQRNLAGQHQNGQIVRASELGLGSEEQFVAMRSGVPAAVTPEDSKSAVIGDLDVATTLKGIPVATGFRILKDSALQHPIDFYAQESGLDQQTIVNLANEFTAHGKKAGIDFYRGPIKVTYGYYAAQAIIALNLLIGNVDHTGGLAAGGGSWDGIGGKPGQPFNLKKLHTGALTPFGVKSNRESSGPYQTTRFSRETATLQTAVVPAHRRCISGNYSGGLCRIPVSH